MADAKKLDTQRIDHLLRPEGTRNVTLTVAGLGSGGAPVVQYLTMCGIGRWMLFDPDRLEPVNLVKHPGHRSDVGKPKVEIMRDWILDRNPAATVKVFQEDVRMNRNFQRAVRASDLVICAVDTNASREYVNDLCVEHQTPCATGLVFREGFGGEVYCFVPGRTGCYRCMQAYCEAAGLYLDNLAEMTPEEEEHVYGMGEKFYQLSGLAIDIGAISNLHANMSLALLVGRAGAAVQRQGFNWLVFSNRAFQQVFGGAFEVRKVFLKAQDRCPISCGERGAATAKNLSFYETLGVSPGASTLRIKGAYRYLAKLYHPDRHSARGTSGMAEAEARFIQLRTAYETLSGKGSGR